MHFRDGTPCLSLKGMISGTWPGGELVRQGRRLCRPWGYGEALWVVTNFVDFTGISCEWLITIVYWLQTREGSILMISYYTSIILRTWWMVGILFGIGKILYFEKFLNWLIRNGWLNTFRSRDGLGHFQRLVNSMFWGKGCMRDLALPLPLRSMCVSMAVVGGKLTFLFGRPRDIWHCLFHRGVCFLGATWLYLIIVCFFYGRTDLLGLFCCTRINRGPQ